MRRLALCLALACAPALSEERTHTEELIGTVGSRSTLLVLHASEKPDGGWHLTGEYIVLANLTRRFLEGERGPELGVTRLKEGRSAILFGRPPTGELRGTYRDGVFKGTRYGPGGQERESFEFSEKFPAMDRYGAEVQCEAGGARYESSLRYAIEAGRLKGGALEWRSSVEPSGHTCRVRAQAQQPLEGGLKFTAGECAVILRDVGEFVKVSAENCAAHCGSEAYLEPLLVDRRGNCSLLRPAPR